MTHPLDEPLHRKSAAELVSDRLMQLIVAGVLEAGEPLRETQLAERLGISRNSLREGIRLLERSRLVKYEMHRGAIVSDPSLADLDDLYRTRRHLETAAVRAAPTEGGLNQLRRAWEHLEASTSVPAAEPIVAADLALHQAIVGLLDSERISAFYASICKELVFYFSVLSHADEEYRYPQTPIVDRHREIVEAILERRVADAERLTLQHIDENQARLTDILRARAAAA
ncbi:GntR family transcriptional regulator [Leucobacter sp. HY1910]